MKFFLVLLINVIIVNYANASEPQCVLKSHQFILNPNSDSRCKSLNIEGSYSMKFCDNNKGLMTGADNSVRYLFVDGDQWKARQDLLHFSNGTQDTEILVIDKNITKFHLSKIKMKKNGAVLYHFDCSGTLESVQ